MHPKCVLGVFTPVVSRGVTVHRRDSVLHVSVCGPCSIPVCYNRGKSDKNCKMNEDSLFYFIFNSNS